MCVASGRDFRGVVDRPNVLKLAGPASSGQAQAKYARMSAI
ncbi:hypothetical protein ACPOL_1751 [Acidisarcina polymorpha]|uniref:Uncharacterized protein n=1 Tax=Acidisarcina polymorpha TaxID=2211140 RepID=A0A2Z5FW25_9BACT|nr:hypothetical protein ACPOL_1751 [Acidisarcina polymorpha]